jgi:DNA-binding NtrC family response regulator
VDIAVTSGPDQGRSLRATDPKIRIGTSRDAHLVLRDPSVSRRHLELVQRSSGWYAQDVGSTNGTFSGSIRIKEMCVDKPLVLTLGETRLRIDVNDARTRARDFDARRIELVGGSRVMRDVNTTIERIAPSELSVLITGETGTGKELAARAIHARSRRANGPFVALDCTALPPTLIESALFGFERGAFTGAEKDYAGAFERANGGTLFLDELGELSVDLQPKLLRAIERREIERLRGDGPLRVDVRVLAATNRHVEDMVRDGSLRSDLYYRLAVVRIELPALRDREGDLPKLIEQFFVDHDDELADMGARARGISPDALAALTGHHFPGNVRELYNVLRRAAIFAQGTIIQLDDLPVDIACAAPRLKIAQASDESNAQKKGLDFKRAKARIVGTFERAYIEELLARHKHNISSASREAGIGRRHLHRLLEKYGIGGGQEL